MAFGWIEGVHTWLCGLCVFVQITWLSSSSLLWANFGIPHISLRILVYTGGRCNVRKWLFVPRDLEMGNLGSTAVQSFVSETREMFKFIAYLKFASARGSVCVRFAKMEHLAVIINERHYTFPSTEYYSRTHTRCFRWACVGTAFRSVCWCGRENWGNSRHTHP